MTRRLATRTVLLGLTLLAATLAGCASKAPADDEPEDIGTITDPGDLSSPSQPHIHDYWGGSDSLLVLDASHPGGTAEGAGPGLAGGSDVVVMAFLPDADDVIPQGTSAMQVTVSWQDEIGDRYVEPSLWVKTAADAEGVARGPLTSGQPITFNVTAAEADLPHQRLSAWRFELRMSSPDPFPLRFKGSVEIQATAMRGLPLPVFPAHPDAWQGQDILPLLSASGTLDYFEDPIDHGCNGFSCPTVHHPDGAIVPHNASFVRVQLTVDEGLMPVELYYHSASSRDFTMATALTASRTDREYQIPVDGDGDGPYATQSQWEFLVAPAAGGAIDVAVQASYTLDVTVTRLG